MKTVLGLAVAFALLFSSANANAGTVVCSGTVEQLAYHADNNLMIKLSSMNTPVFFCNTDAVWSPSGAGYTTSPGACKALYSTFLSAKVTGATITSMYFDGDSVPATCDAWPAWSHANIRFYSY